jgi:hypothetical protein
VWRWSVWEEIESVGRRWRECGEEMESVWEEVGSVGVDGECGRRWRVESECGRWRDGVWKEIE